MYMYIFTLAKDNLSIAQTIINYLSIIYKKTLHIGITHTKC